LVIQYVSPGFKSTMVSITSGSPPPGFAAGFGLPMLGCQDERRKPVSTGVFITTCALTSKAVCRASASIRAPFLSAHAEMSALKVAPFAMVTAPHRRW
jgi:hypothetical protein